MINYVPLIRIGTRRVNSSVPLCLRAVPGPLEMKRGEQLAPCRRDGACRNVIHQLSFGTNNHLTRNRSSFKVPCSEVAERWPSFSTREDHALTRSSLPPLFPPRRASTRRRSVCYKTMIAYPVSRYAIKRRLNPII